MPDDPTAPVTGDLPDHANKHASSHAGEHGDLLDQIEDAIGPAMRIGLQDAQLYDEPGAERIEEWIAWITKTVVARLESRLPLGDLPERMVEAIAQHHIDPSRNDRAQDADTCACGELVDDWDAHWAAAAASVRWPAAASVLAENARLSRALEHAEAELSSRTEQHLRAVNRATAAEGARDAAGLIVAELQALRDSLYGQLDSAQQRAETAEAQVAVLQQALADRGDDVLAFQKACGTHLPEQAAKIRAERDALTEQVAALQHELAEIRQWLRTLVYTEDVRALLDDHAPAQATTQEKTDEH